MARPRAWNNLEQISRWWERGIYFGAAAAGLIILTVVLPGLSWIWPLSLALLAGSFLCAVGMLVNLAGWRRTSRTEGEELSQMTPDALAAEIERLRPNTGSYHFSLMAGAAVIVLMLGLILLHNRLPVPLIASMALAMVALAVLYVYFGSRT